MQDFALASRDIENYQILMCGNHEFEYFHSFYSFIYKNTSHQLSPHISLLEDKKYC